MRAAPPLRPDGLQRRPLSRAPPRTRPVEYRQPAILRRKQLRETHADFATSGRGFEENYVKQSNSPSSNPPIAASGKIPTAGINGPFITFLDIGEIFCGGLRPNSGIRTEDRDKKPRADSDLKDVGVQSEMMSDDIVYKYEKDLESGAVSGKDE